MTKDESLHCLDECIAYLDGLSDEEIDNLADEADKYMKRPIEPSGYSSFEIMPGFRPHTEMED